MVELSNDDIKCMGAFESITGAMVMDCLIAENAVAFIVKKGDLGHALLQRRFGCDLHLVSK